MLRDVNLARSGRSGWRAAPVRQVFAARRIIAFEAKISDWPGVLEQASLNRWFASESYVLAPRGPRDPAILTAIRSLGIGLWIEGERRPSIPVSRRGASRPISYASWLFNEWAWRESMREVKGSGDRGAMGEADVSSAYRRGAVGAGRTEGSVLRTPPIRRRHRP